MRAVDPTGPFPFAPRGCGRYGDHLDLYAEGELRDEALLRAVRAHLEACASCRDYLEDHDALTREILAADDDGDARWMGPFRARRPPLRGAGLGRGAGFDLDDSDEFPRWGDLAGARRRLGRVLAAVEALPAHDPDAHERVAELEIARLLRARPTVVRGRGPRAGRRFLAAAALIFAAGLAFAILAPAPRSPGRLAGGPAGPASDPNDGRGAVPVPAAAAEAAPARLGPLLWKFASAEAEVAPPEPRAPGSPLVLVGFRPAALPRDPDRIAAHLAGPASPAVAIEWVVEATLADGRELEGQRLFLVSEAGIGAADPATLEWVEIAPRALRACGASHPGTVLSTSGDTYRAFVVHGAGRWTTSLLVLPPGSLPAATRAEAAHDARLEALLRGERRGQEAWQEWVTPASWRP